ncbi:uncharacterized protein EI90DRAFT_2364536 [Cantharellus anzutake]|uniref:uncharacterized protein n=1 Tax=Cantharellus anzutake TaxID=1750568 RepID=UPI0019083126|nr:uncharacterized protein EI90DRAFT_2364536 [Cantharellus anzutake]KAF8324154.1 hypothetical protein EI90DRAFT_2364536 [Cantharellus anzutake]
MPRKLGYSTSIAYQFIDRLFIMSISLGPSPTTQMLFPWFCCTDGLQDRSSNSLTSFLSFSNRNTRHSHIIAPSLPGYGWTSGSPPHVNLNVSGMARMVDKLVTGIGFRDYGGDIGSSVLHSHVPTLPPISFLLPITC